MTRRDDHECVFPEVEILEPDANLSAGVKVLAPCRCGETALDHLETLNRHAEELTQALARVRPTTPLYHWSPSSRRRQIVRYGLRPFMRATTALSAETDTALAYPVICFADSPSWAWALSGGMRWTERGSWDLWQTDIGRLTEPIILPSEDRLSGIYEVRTLHRVYKRDLWHVGTRTTESAR